MKPTTKAILLNHAVNFTVYKGLVAPALYLYRALRHNCGLCSSSGLTAWLFVIRWTTK